MTNEEIMEIGKNVAMEWGGECYDFAREEDGYVFYCIEAGERFTTFLKDDELEQFKEERY